MYHKALFIIGSQILVFCEIQDWIQVPGNLATQVCQNPDFTKVDICYSYSEVRIEACQFDFFQTWTLSVDGVEGGHFVVISIAADLSVPDSSNAFQHSVSDSDIVSA